MKLKRAWPAIMIWVVFIIFDIVMVASCSFFSGLFPTENGLLYSAAFTVLAVLIMSLLTILLGRVSDRIQVDSSDERTLFRVLYGVLFFLIIAGGVAYRIQMIPALSGDATGKLSLYENAMVGATDITPENDLLSIVYTGILRVILLFTGNIISVPFYFQIFCFTVFMICGFVTVHKLLGKLAAIAFAAYVAFVPVFTTKFTGPLISTDSLFMAMFGIEMLIVALYLSGSYRQTHESPLWILWYLFVGAIVGFMAYVDAGTIIMILPFILANLMFYDRKLAPEIKRFLILLAGALAGFFAMIIQDMGIANVGSSLVKWGPYYFHNLNTFSMFWTYTDYKIMYLITVAAMSGVIVGFWRNKNIEKVSPWLFSMILIFSTVPFMGATRMNTQVFVTVYYAFIIACVASLIALPSYEDALPRETALDEDAAEANEDLDEEEPQPEEEEISGQEVQPEDEEILMEEELSESEEVPVEEQTEEEMTLEEKLPEEEETPEEEVRQELPEQTEQTEPEQTEVPDEFEHLEESDIEGEVEEDRRVNVDSEYDDAAQKGQAVTKEEYPEEILQEESEDTAIADDARKYDRITEDYVSGLVLQTVELSEKLNKLTGGSTVFEDNGEAEPEEIHETEQADENNDEDRAETAKAGTEAERTRYVPEGMILPEDDEDMDQTPRMRMPQFKGLLSVGGKDEKLKIKTSVRTFDELPAKDDFDIAFRPGDDFDI